MECLCTLHQFTLSCIRGILFPFLCCCPLYLFGAECSRIFYSFWPRQMPISNLVVFCSGRGGVGKTLGLCFCSEVMKSNRHISKPLNTPRSLLLKPRPRDLAWHETCSSLFHLNLVPSQSTLCFDLSFVVLLPPLTFPTVLLSGGRHCFLPTIRNLTFQFFSHRFCMAEP